MKWIRLIGKAALFALFLAFTIITFDANLRDVLMGGRVYFDFAEGDCYSQMTRVQMVLQHPLTTITHHDFENYPQGTEPHTTMPMDWLIALLAKILKPLSPQAVDWAGAFISPLLGLLTAIFLWFWSARLPEPMRRYRAALLFLFAASPIIVHGFQLGRPRHQSLQMLLITIGIAAEWLIALRSSAEAASQSIAKKWRWPLASGIAWALALWVSLYEPLILFLFVFILQTIFYRKTLFSRTRIPGAIAFVAILALAFCVEGWRYHWPDQMLLTYFPHWEKTIGELTSVSPLNPLLYRWTGWLLAISPILLLLRARIVRRDRLAWPMLILLVIVYALTLWQIRWGYFFAIIFVLALPWMLAALRWRWLAWTLFIVSLWPVARGWDALLPAQGSPLAEIKAVQRDEILAVRDAADFLKTQPPVANDDGILAPWWESPALAYWSGHPAVAGTSHESIAGIVDSAQFFLTANRETARAILLKRHVRYVVVTNPQHILDKSAVLLNQQPPQDPMAKILFEMPHSAPPFLRLVYWNSLCKVFVFDARAPLSRGH